MTKKKTICPRCKVRELGPCPALSRRDSKTGICSLCGSEEGLFDYSMRGEPDGAMVKCGSGDKITVKQARKRERAWLTT